MYINQYQTHSVLTVLNPLDAVCDRKRTDAVCVSNLKNAKAVDKSILVDRPDVKIFLPFRFYVYEPKNLFVPNTYNKYLVAPTGDHLISLIDEISYVPPHAPMISQIEDISPAQFCNGDNRPPDCGPNCQCTHKVDIPLGAIVEVVLVDEVQQTNLSHPFHLHGTAFYIVGLGRSPDKSIQKINLKHTLDLDRMGMLKRDFTKPALKDTIAVPNNGYSVLRFRADNPVASDQDHLISLIDEISFASPPSPILSQYHEISPESFCNGDNRPANCGENCHCTHKIDVPLNAVVEIVLVDEVQQVNISHPFHLHGLPFYVLGMGRSPDAAVTRMDLKHALEWDRRGMLERKYSKIALKDTVAVPNNGYSIIRFKADNPGVWLFHCHFIYHIVIGMNLVIQIGTPEDFPPVPPSFPKCGNHLPPITPVSYW